MSRSTKPTLVCAALPFGYGPAAKLLALCEGLARDVRLVFVGEGSALELVSRSPVPFAEIVPVAAGSPTADERIARADAVLSVMDRATGSAAARLGRPLHVLDSLLWMRASVPDELAHARTYRAQAFLGLEPERYEPRPVVVGPILSPALPPRAREGLVVHLGGSAAPDDRRSLYDAYAAFVVRAVVAAGLARRFARVTVLAGSGVVAAASHAASASGGAPAVRVESLSPAAASERLAGAAMVLTAPGLTTTLECFRDGTPTAFLPPQNYSQWCALRRLRAAGAAEGSLHWEDLPGAPRLADRMDAAACDPVVRATVERLSRDAGALAAATDSIARAVDSVPTGTAVQRALFASLGPGGVESTVAALRRELLARPVSTPSPAPAPLQEGSPR